MRTSPSRPTAGRARQTRRIPDESFFYERLVPILLLILGLVMAALIIIAAGVLLGFIQYR